MTITTILAFGVGITAGFVVGVFVADRYNVRTQHLTDLSGRAINKVRTTYKSITNEESNRKTPSFGSSN